MRLAHKRTKSSKPELVMTSMIDVVFLLLIYFMTTTAIWRTEQELNPAIEVERSKQAAASSDLQPLVVDVVMGSDGPMFRIGLRDIATVEELRVLARGYPNKENGAFIRVSDDVPFAMAAAALHVCSSENFLPVSYIPKEDR